jgi:hypothetical protein
LEGVADDGLQVVNNIIYVHRDDPFDNPASGRLPVVEHTLAPGDSSMALWR